MWVHDLSICRVVPRAYYSQSILFSWGDVVPNAELDIGKFNENLVVTWGDECRYKFNTQTGKIELHPKGNVIGIYHVAEYRGLNNYVVCFYCVYKHVCVVGVCCYYITMLYFILCCYFTICCY